MSLGLHKHQRVFTDGQGSTYSTQCRRMHLVTTGATNQDRIPSHSSHGKASAGGWRWPFHSKQNEPETEIIYVTDTAEADEIEHLSESAVTGHVPSHQAPGTAATHQREEQQSQATKQIGIDEAGLSIQEQHQQQPVPEAHVSASLAALQPAAQQAQQLDQLQQVVPETPSPTTTSSSNSSAYLVHASPPQTTAAPAASQGSPSALSGYWASAAGGWVVAVALLLAVRQGRSHADAARLDVRALQARQQDSRVQDRVLKEKRAQYLQQQQLLKEEAAAKRLAEKARQAEHDRREAAAKAAEYEKAALEELERLRARRAAAKKAFEESQGKLDEELAARTAKEIELREEAEAKKAAEEAAARAAAAAEAARAAAEASAAAEAAERAAREAAAARDAVKQQMRDRSFRYQVHLRGSAVAAPLASSSTSRQPQMSVQLSLAPTSNSSSSRGRACAPVATANRVYDTPDAALEGAASLAEDVALQVFTHYIPAAAAGVVDMEGMSVVQPGSSSSGSSAPEASQPPGQETAAAAAAAEGDSSDAVKRVVLSGADLMLWRLLLLVKLEAAAGQAIGQVALLAASGELQQDFRVSVTYSTLPQDDSNNLQQQLQQVADLASQQQLPAATQLLDDLIEWQLEDFTNRSSLPSSSSSTSSSSSSVSLLLQQLVGSSMAGGGSPASPYLVPACLYAVLLNTQDPATQDLNKRTSASSSPSPSSNSSGSPSGDLAGPPSGTSTPDSSLPSSPDDTAADDDDMFDALEDADASQTGSITGTAAAAAAAAARRSITSSRDSTLQRLAKVQLEQLAKAAPPDELMPVAVSLRLLLGRRHPVAAAMQLLAERNMTMGARQARELKRQQRQLARATELLKGSPVVGPGGLDPQAARLKQQLVPAPERIWALRNVANSMLRSATFGAAGSSGSSAAAGGDAADSISPAAEEALSMLRQAAYLAADHYGDNHPGQLSALLDYISGLLVVPGHRQEAKAAIETACGIVQAVGERYRKQRDLLSLVLLFESTQAELDVPEVVGRECAPMTRIQRQAADAFSVLETAQANLVMSKRKVSPGSPSSPLRQLARDCTEELGVYAVTRKRATRLEQWNKDLPLAPLR